MDGEGVRATWSRRSMKELRRRVLRYCLTVEPAAMSRLSNSVRAWMRARLTGGECPCITSLGLRV